MNKFSAVLNRRRHLQMEGQSLKLGADFNPIIGPGLNCSGSGSGSGYSGVAGRCSSVVNTIDVCTDCVAMVTRSRDSVGGCCWGFLVR